MKSRPLLPRLLISLLGVGMVALAVLASLLGLDHNTEWGPGRRWIFTAGLVFLAAGFWPSLRTLSSWSAGAIGRIAVGVGQRVEAGMAASMAGASVLRFFFAVLQTGRATASRAGSLVRFPESPAPSRARLAALFTVLAVVCTETAYVFIVSVGSWSKWPEETAYYSLLSESFRRGQVHLVVEPDPLLVALENPYDFAARREIPVLWDASYYKGKYYLYWGPAPALVLAVVETLSGKGIGDQYLVFIFVSLINVCLAWNLFYLWRKLFSRTSPLLLATVVAGSGMAGPLPWLLGRPAVYEAAIAGGQAFLLLGLAAALPAWVEGRASPGRLVVTGVAWALTAGSRPTLLLAFLLPTACLVVRWLQQRPVLWRPFASLLLPLAIGGLGLAGYNFARFANPLETGVTYILTGLDLRANANEMFSLRYLAPNLFNYLWMPPRSLSVFPFIKPQWGVASVPIIGSRPGELYGTQQVAGVLRTTPFVWSALYPMGLAFLGRVRGRRRSQPRLESLTLFLAAVVVGGLAGMAAFFYATMRYQADFVPALYLLATVGAWMAIEDLRGHRLWRWTATLVLVWLSVDGLRQGLLLAITGYNARFELLNPELFDQLTRFFAR